jgi:hypothetical protein
MAVTEQATRQRLARRASLSDRRNCHARRVHSAVYAVIRSATSSVRNLHRAAVRRGHCNFVDGTHRRAGALAGFSRKVTTPTELGRHALLGDHGDRPAHGIAGLMFPYGAEHSGDRQSVQGHSRTHTPILSVARTPCLYWISDLELLHASPAVAVRETVPRRFARYRAIVNNDSGAALYHPHNALKSSGT